MIKNILKITFRYVIKDKMFFMINITGLSIGIAVCLLLISWNIYELSFEEIHKNRNDLYKIITKSVFPSAKISHSGQTPMLLADYMRKNIPEVKNAAIYWRRIWELKKGDKQFKVKGVLTEPDFLKMFSFPFLRGSPEALLSEPGSIAISESLSRKLFGDKESLGKRLTEIGYGAGDFIIKGVFQDLPSNSHMKFEFIAPFDLKNGGYGFSFNKWDLNDFETYVLLRKNSSQKHFNAKIKGIYKKHLPDTVKELYSLNIKNIHLNDDVWSHNRGSRTNVFVFSIIAFLIFLLACINYTNLTIAKGAARKKEVGIMKVVGANMESLLFKFLTESAVFSFISILFGVFLAYLFQPLTNRLTGSPFQLHITDKTNLIIIILIFILTVLVAGLYPSLHLSSLKPITMLKESIIPKKKLFSFRKIMVIFQFSVFILLTICFISIYKQMVFVLNQNPGFDKDRVMQIEATSDLVKDWRTFRTELLKSPDINSFTWSNTVPGKNESVTNDWDWEGKEGNNKIKISIVGVYDDFIETFGMKIKKGLFYSREFPSDLKNGIVINEEAAKIMGFKDPVGKIIKIGNINLPYSRKIIGVVKNYHFSSLRDKIGPMVMVFRFGLDTLFIRINNQKIQPVISHVQKVFKKFAPNDTLNYTFMNEGLSRLYSNEQKLIDSLKYFTILAIFISALGLYGIAVYNANQRTKEIAIRKINGAGISDIVYLLIKDSLKWVVLANIVAFPLAFWIITLWLQNFAYKSNITILSFLIASGGAFAISLLVILNQAIKASRTDPVNSLRNE